ncbi:hypothetical protein [Aureimonas sp. AU20]|uniref:hypothetical protein n=1 Tax=Aureimonas sp. AU20 TaxID=1349819 RepID=UPI000721164B|nr:hypothetical protein [Aureimonas sp. AU20]ALN75319.1 hypothetical protein M673_21525 [Aureimonas sp. AU20]
MKRTIGPFAVEHKRRSKLNKAASTSIWTGALSDEMKDLLRANAGAETDEPAASADVAPRPRKGGGEAKGRSPRILETRILQAREESLPATEIEETSEPELPVRTKARKPRKVERTDAPEPVHAPPPVSIDEAEPDAFEWDEPAEASAALVQETPRLPIDAPARRMQSRVAQRRARMKDLPFEQRWKWNLIP